MTVYIGTPTMNVYSELTFDDAHKALVDGSPIPCWWYGDEGQLHEEVILFTEFTTLRTCNELKDDDA